MKVIFRIKDSAAMTAAVIHLIYLLQTKGSFANVDEALLTKISREPVARQSPQQPWDAAENQPLWQSMLTMLSDESWALRWSIRGGKYTLYYHPDRRHWVLNYRGDQFSLHSPFCNGEVGNYLRAMMFNLGGKPFIHRAESPGLAWTDIEGTEAAQKKRRAQDERDRAAMMARRTAREANPWPTTESALALAFKKALA